MLPRTLVRRSVAPLVLTALLGVVSCSKDTSSSSSGTTTTIPSRCAPKTGEKAAKALSRCATDSVAYVENEDATGTGVVIERKGKRYILTNAHVVDPFDTADITVAGARTEAVPVLGIDAGADIALVGPLTTKAELTALTVATTTTLERGDDVYLVGFPGEVSTDDPADLETTIASGIVSRTREVKEFGQKYFQTDASIAGGQSGGPLFDDKGSLVGISGLSFADDEFALVLSGTDVDEAITRILKGDGDDYPAVPRTETDDMVEKGTIELRDASETQQLFIPSSDEDRTLDFTLDMTNSPVVSITSNVKDDPIAISHNTTDVLTELQKQVAASKGGKPDEIPDPSAYGIDEKAMKPETSPGVFHVDLAADEDTYIAINAPLAPGAFSATFTSSIPVTLLAGTTTEEPIKVGDSVDRVLQSFDNSADYLLDLKEGQKVEILAASPQSDLGMVIIDPGVQLTPIALFDLTSAEGVEMVDDSDEGLYGLDALKALTAKTAGTYRIRLYSNDGVTVLARLSVKDCDEAKCGKSAKSSKTTTTEAGG